MHRTGDRREEVRTITTTIRRSNNKLHQSINQSINQSTTFRDLPNARSLVEIREIFDLHSVKTELSDIGTSNRSSLSVNHIDNPCGFIDSQSTGSDDTVVEAFTIMYMREKMLEISL